MIEFAVIKKFLVDLFQKLGIAGTIAVFLFGLVAIQHEEIKLKTEKIAKLELSVKEQNDATEKAGKARDALQAQLKGAQDLNKIITKQYEDQRKKISQKPIATTCEGAMTEIRSTMKDVSQKWNAQ